MMTVKVELQKIYNQITKTTSIDCLNEVGCGLHGDESPPRVHTAMLIMLLNKIKKLEKQVEALQQRSTL